MSEKHEKERRRSTRVMVTDLEQRFDKFLDDFQAFRSSDESWKGKHEGNHHGMRSKVTQGVPWTILAILANAAIIIARGQ